MQTTTDDLRSPHGPRRLISRFHAKSWRLACLLLLLISLPAYGQVDNYQGAGEPSTAIDNYGQGVRETEWQAAEMERLGFHLPPGFEIELFASEPQVSKPLNMAWDRRGRLWVTCTVEYPYPAKDGAETRDSIKILEDTDGDGAADQVTTFADQLNIPIGILPVDDGVICFSIPNLWHLKDNDGDGKVDERIKLLGPFDTTRDTHGMVNSLSRGSDGWIYACHGFNNQSNVTASDGSSVSLSSGNTFRFKPDGSRVELYTRGQVNPFGMTRDEWGNWYTADCHSKPLTGLLAGGCYPSFGRPHDGLGFAPDMMKHLHGSTAICGICYYQGEHFPAAYRHLIYSGNVMTSRVNCNAIQWQGATAHAVEQADFLTSDDPWFRPVDIQLGPDGALYVADFYNKIIGHYEVPLEHPGRDRESGRIWRIVYRGDHEHAPEIGLPAFGSALSNNPTDSLSTSNITLRRLAIDACVADKNLQATWLQSVVQDASHPTLLRQTALEILHRSSQLDSTSLLAILNDSEPELSVLALRLAAEHESDPEILLAARIRLQDSRHPHVRLAAVQLVGKLGGAGDVRALLHIEQDLLAFDPVMAQGAKIATRQLLRNDAILAQVCGGWSGMDLSQHSIAIDDSLAPALAHVLPGLESELAAVSLLHYVAMHPESESTLVEQAIQAASKFANEALTNQLLALIDQLSKGDLIDRATRFHQLCKAALARRPELSSQLMRYGQDLQSKLFIDLSQRIATSGKTVDWTDQSGAPWALEKRNCSDAKSAWLMSSLSRGEKYTGVLRSEVVECPTELTFWLAGHNGAPAKADQRQNMIRLLSATTGQSLKQVFPPRNDVAVRVDWSLAEFAGQPVRMEVIDADAGAAFAWLAIGRFSKVELELGNVHEVLEAISANLTLNMMTDHFAGDLQRLDLSPRQRARLIAATLKGRAFEPAATLAQQAIALNRSDLIQVDLLDEPAEDRFVLIAQELCASASTTQQAAFASSLLATPKGCSLLQQLLQQGSLGLTSLHGVNALLPSSLAEATKQFLDQQLSAARELDIAATQAKTQEINARLSRLDWNAANHEQGKQLFKQHCAVCHKLGEEGNVIGPQLDGAVVRGATRLSEDILDPSRNVDRAFRLTSLLLDNDSVLSGLVRDEADGSVTVTKQDGKSESIPAASISQRRESTQSLMANNFGEVLNDEQLASLLKFLADSAPSLSPKP